MTITGPKLVRVTEGCVIFWMSLTGPLRSALSAAVKALTERTRSIVFPGTDLLIQGLRLRSFSTDSTAGWSKRFASFATYARVSLSFTAIASGRSAVRRGLERALDRRLDLRDGADSGSARTGSCACRL